MQNQIQEAPFAGEGAWEWSYRKNVLYVYIWAFLPLHMYYAGITNCLLRTISTVQIWTVPSLLLKCAGNFPIYNHKMQVCILHLCGKILAHTVKTLSFFSNEGLGITVVKTKERGFNLLQEVSARKDNMYMEMIGVLPRYSTMKFQGSYLLRNVNYVLNYQWMSGTILRNVRYIHPIAGIHETVSYWNVIIHDLAGINTGSLVTLWPAVHIAWL